MKVLSACICNQKFKVNCYDNILQKNADMDHTINNHNGSNYYWFDDLPGDWPDIRDN